LTGFVNLEHLDCSYNKLTLLDISDCEKIEIVNCSGNELTNLVLPPKGEKLTGLILSHNQLTNLTIFSHLENLECLLLSGNPLSGSCKYLQNCRKLENLDIGGTDLNSGLEYLPEGLKEFICEGKLVEQLKDYEKDGHYDYQAWNQSQQIKSLEDENAKIEGLEDDIVRLTNLTNEQRKKIVDAYLKFAPEKELLKDLIITSYEFCKFKKTSAESHNYNDRCEEYETKC